MKLVIGVGFLTASFFGFLVLTAPAAAQRRAECRAMETDTGGKRETQTMCRGADGVWRPEQQPESPDALPPDFRGRITYQGNFSGRRVTPGRPPRRLDLRSILNSAASARTREFAGATTIEIEYDGSLVRATYMADRQRGAFTGTRRGADCRVIDSGDGGVGTFRCDRNVFSGTFENPPGAPESYTSRVETHATQFVDAAEAERQRQAMAETQRQAALRAPPTPAAPSGTSQAPGQRLVITTAALGVTLNELLDRIVYADSRTWHFNRYARGSMREAQYETSNRNHTTFIARGNYSYSQGDGPLQAGWARVWIRNGDFACIEFHDDPAICRPLNVGLSQRFFGAMTEALGTAILQDAGLTGVCARTTFVRGMPVMTPIPC